MIMTKLMIIMMEIIIMMLLLIFGTLGWSWKGNHDHAASYMIWQYDWDGKKVCGQIENDLNFR